MSRSPRPDADAMRVTRVDAPLRPLASLLVESVRGYEGPLEDRGALDDVGALHDAVTEHRIAPAVWRRLRSAGVDDGAALTALAALRHQQLLRHMRSIIELRDLGAVLGRAGIPWVVAKGPVAADVIWPRPDMREYHDLDIFVDRRAFADALDALLSCGYTLADRNWPVIAAEERAELALIAPHGTPVDLHWHMAVPGRLRRAFSIDVSAAIDRRISVPLGDGTLVPTFDPVDTVLHLAFHAAQAGAGKLMWAGDIHYALQRPDLDLAEMVERAARAGITVPTALVLDRVVTTLGTPVVLPRGADRRAAGIWASVVRRVSGPGAFPVLPGDSHAGNNLYSGARRTVGATVAAAVALTIEARRRERALERSGPEGRVLERDVPDLAARSAYFQNVLAGAES